MTVNRMLMPPAAARLRLAAPCRAGSSGPPAGKLRKFGNVTGSETVQVTQADRDMPGSESAFLNLHWPRTGPGHWHGPAQHAGFCLQNINKARACVVTTRTQAEALPRVR